MVRKKISKIIMLISIISAVLLITPSFGAATEADITLTSDDRIDETIKEQEPVDPIDPLAGTNGFEDVGNTAAGTTGEETIINDDGESSMGSLMWLIVDGDQLLDDGSGNDLEGTIDGSTGDLAGSDEMNLDGSINGDVTLPADPDPSIEVDEVFIASANGVVDKELSLGTSIPLNILGHVRINVLQGDSNIDGKPYFDGYDVFDNTAFAITTTSVMIALSIAKALRLFGKPILQSVQFGIYVTSQVLDAILDYILYGEFNLYIDFSFGGLNLIFNFEGKILEAIIESLAKPILEFIQTHFEISLYDVILSIKEALQNPEIENTYVSFISGDIPLWAGIGAMIKRLRGKAYYPDIYDWLTQDCKLSSYKADQVISFLQTSDDAFKSLRVNTIGQFDVFLTHGHIEENGEVIQLRNLRVDLQNGVADGYAAVIEIVVKSAGNIVDSRTIGIVYDGSGNDGEEVVGMETAPLNSQPLVEGTGTTETTGSSSTEMSGTTGSTSL